MDSEFSMTFKGRGRGDTRMNADTYQSRYGSSNSYGRGYGYGYNQPYYGGYGYPYGYPQAPAMPAR